MLLKLRGASDYDENDGLQARNASQVEARKRACLRMTGTPFVYGYSVVTINIGR